MERHFALFALWWKFRLQWKGFQGRHTLPWSTSAKGCPAAGGRLLWLWSPPCPALSVHTANFSDMKESWFCLNNSTRILCFILILKMIVESIAVQNCMFPSTSLEPFLVPGPWGLPSQFSLRNLQFCISRKRWNSVFLEEQYFFFFFKKKNTSHLTSSFWDQLW